MSKGQNSISFATQRANVSKFKIVFVGDQGVGKSSIINSYIKNQFDTAHNPTVGIDFVSKNLNIKGKTVRLQLWDTAGQQRFRSLIPSYLKDCNAAFIVYDITNQSSFQSITKWLDFVKESRGNDSIIYILGNKTDLQSQRVVDVNRVQQLAKSQDIPFTEVSAKTGSNLNDVFRTICSKLLGFPIQQIDINQSQIKGIKAPNMTDSLASSVLNVNTTVSKPSNPNPISNKSTVLTNNPPQRPNQTRSNCC